MQTHLYLASLQITVISRTGLLPQLLAVFRGLQMELLLQVQRKHLPL